MRVLIAIPCMDNIPTNFFESFVHMRTVGESFIQLTKATLIYDARDQLADAAIRGNYDYVFWLDSDMVFTPDLMEKMFASLGDKDFLTGLYFTRRTNIKPTISKVCEGWIENNSLHSAYEAYMDYPECATFEVASSGFGCCITSVKMLKDVFKTFGLPFVPAFGFGEDLSFCMRARQIGYKLYCDSAITLGHIMQTESNETLYKKAQEEGTYNA